MWKRKALFLLCLPLLLAVPLPAQDGAAPGAAEPDVLVGIPTLPSLKAAKVLDTQFYRYHVFELPLAEIDRQVRSRGRLALHLGNETLDLELELNDLRGDGYRAVLVGEDGAMVEIEPPPVATFRGRVGGDPESIVRLTVREDRLEGYVRTSDSWIFIEPLSLYDPGAGAASAVVYRDGDTRPLPAGWCESGPADPSLHARLEAAIAGAGSFAKRAVSSKTLEVATDSDGQFTERYGVSGALSRIQTILNTVDGIYRSDLDLEVDIVFQVVWSSAANDPYSDPPPGAVPSGTVNSSTRLNEFRNYWNNNFAWVDRDTAHLFSGGNFEGSVRGRAWVGVVCRNPTLAYGISEDRVGNLDWFTTTVAHEIGHNLNASHSDGCAGVDCSDCGSGDGPIMCACVQPNRAECFADCSITTITNYVNLHGSCLN